MTIPDLSRLEHVELREKFKTEAGDFTPWLADESNISLLGDTIGLDLEVEAQEKEVGPFRADILCKDTADDTWVLIENQLERTDHTHLGQLMTYASGLKAVTIIWIAQKFTEEHRAAIDWLNEITDSDFKFFGIEVELWKIGNSEVAPKFNIVSKPNEWSRAVARGQEGITDARQLQLRFWNAFKSYVEDHGSQIRTGKPGPQNWMNISLGKTGYQLLAVASMWDQESHSYSKNEIRAELYVSSEESKSKFVVIESQREVIEKELGYELTWLNPEEMKSARAFTRKTVDLNDEADWMNQHAWLLENLVKLQKVFKPFTR
ncbi:MAG: DUF4268 domain-containing protein [Bacteroidetes bacterium]|jgi:hypothetical protein|nr:DUF4268 domain-containing protein [Bacteroidota bacterium]